MLSAQSAVSLSLSLLPRFGASSTSSSSASSLFLRDWGCEAKGRIELVVKLSGMEMRHVAALRTSLLGLAVLMVAVGIWTSSLKKMLGTYAFGISGIAVILLPDWEFFDRDFSKWFTPMPAHRSSGANWAADNFRLKFFPLRLALITLIYGFGLYKWWTFQLS